MKKIELDCRKIARKIFGGISFTAMAFVFQACYGMPDDTELFNEVKLSGTVRAKSTKLPVEGITIAVNDDFNYYGITDKDGNFSFYANVPRKNYYSEKDGITYSPNSVNVHFHDTDSIENGWFSNRTIIINPVKKDEIKIDIELEEKQ